MKGMVKSQARSLASGWVWPNTHFQRIVNGALGLPLSSAQVQRWVQTHLSVVRHKSVVVGQPQIPAYSATELIVYRFLISLTAALSLLTLSFHTSAQTDASTAEALMRSSGMWQQLASIAPQVRAGFLEGASRAAQKPSPAEIERLSKAIDDAYSTDRLRSIALVTFRADTKADHVPALRRWYSSRVGKKITGLEEAASVAQTDPQAVAQQGTALLSRMPAARRALLEEFVVVTRSAEIVTQIAIGTALAAQRGVLSVTPNAPSTAEDEFRAALEAQRPQLLQAFAGLSLASYAIAYEKLPTSELAQYIKFLKSEPGRQFMDVGAKALTAALSEAAADLGRRLPGTKSRASS